MMLVNNSDLLGKVLGTCTLETLIGRGGMSSVYLARQSLPERHVAVKILRPHFLTEEMSQDTFIARFQHEANIVARLEHINIIPIFEYGEQDQLAYLVMPHVSGGSLAQLLEKQPKLTINQTIEYAQQAAAALDYAHAHGVIHRDLKPSNLLIYPDGRLVLADFGIAHIIEPDNSEKSTLTPLGILLGTPLYMAPEMVYGKQADRRTDLYTLGIILFQMLSGEVPFKGESTFAILNQHVQRPLPALHERDQTISSEVDIVLQKATAKEREERYATAGALIQALKNALNWQYSTSNDYIYNLTKIPMPPRPMQTPLVKPPPSTFPDLQVVHTPASTFQMEREGLLVETEKGQLGKEIVTPALANPGKQTAPEGELRRPLLTAVKLLPICALLLCGIYLGVKTGGVTTRSTSSPAYAKSIVQQYYNDINTKNYSAAYALLAPSFQQTLSYKAFAKIYANTIRDDIVVYGQKEQPDGSILVIVEIEATEQHESRRVNSNYLWSGTMVEQNGLWRIMKVTEQQQFKS